MKSKSSFQYFQYFDEGRYYGTDCLGLVVATRLMNVLSYQDRENQKQTHSSKPGCRDTLRNVAAGLYPASEKIKLNTCGKFGRTDDLGR